ncbi:unnamed protein product, partial [Allacma fusca]
MTSGHPPGVRLAEMTNSSNITLVLGSNSSVPVESVIMNGSVGSTSPLKTLTNSTITIPRNSTDSNVSTPSKPVRPDLNQYFTTDAPFQSPLVQTNIT